MRTSTTTPSRASASPRAVKQDVKAKPRHQAAIADAPPLSCLAALEHLGDAVALIDRRTQAAVHGTPPLLPLLEAAGAHAAWPVALTQWELALPGLLQGLRNLQEGQGRWRCGPSGDHTVEAAALDERWLVLRLVDEGSHQRAQREALRRQLHDRESLLFTSRSVSVGEVGSVLAHELNQPIGTIANLLRGLRLRLSKRAASDAGAADELAAIERAIDQVMFAARVIARIREFTHARAPQLESLDLGVLLQSSASLLDWDWQRTGVALELVLPAEAVHVQGDATMLQQVVTNLMRNALDALRENPPSAPRVVLSLRREDQAAVVSIADNGAGMSADAEQRLFVPFTSSKPTGLGIGLSICRSFVELHQGRLWFSRNETSGCTFFFRLPLAAQGKAEAGETPAPPPGASS